MQKKRNNDISCRDYDDDDDDDDDVDDGGKTEPNRLLNLGFEKNIMTVEMEEIRAK